MAGTSLIAIRIGAVPANMLPLPLGEGVGEGCEATEADRVAPLPLPPPARGGGVFSRAHGPILVPMGPDPAMTEKRRPGALC